MITDLSAKARRLGARTEPLLAELPEREAALQALELLASEDLLAWTVPERDGGAATGGLVAADTVSVRALCAIREGLSHYSGMLDVMLVMQGLGSHAVSLGGSDALRAELLGGVARGEAIAAFALTEPGAGSSLGDVSTRAVRTEDGYRLSGRKTFISNAGLASFYSVLARTSGDAGDGGRETLSMFCVPAQSRGLAVEPFEVMAPHPIGDVVFEDVEVPASHLLGEEGDGLGLALATLQRFRTSVAAAANGFAGRALAESRERLATREQFGRPLASFQALRFDLAEMDTRLRAAQLLVEEAADCVDAGGDAAAPVARAKLYATETASWICDRAVQHFGGLGVKRGTPVERLYREVRALRIYEGTSEIQKLVLAKELLKRRPEDGSKA